MSHILAAIDADQSARPVLGAAHALAHLLGVGVVALHVAGDRHDRELPVAVWKDVELRSLHGDVVEQIMVASRRDEVVAVALGTRRSVDGRRPAGRTTLALIGSIGKPVMVVPPDAQPRERFTRLVLPLGDDGEHSPALAGLIARARTQGLEVIALHLHSGASVPAFSDHEPHAMQAWGREFITRQIGHQNDVRLVRRVGVPHEDVADAVRDVDADLVMLSWSQRLLPGRARVVSKMLADARVPVLLMPMVPDQVLLMPMAPDQRQRTSGQ